MLKHPPYFFSVVQTYGSHLVPDMLNMMNKWTPSISGQWWDSQSVSHNVNWRCRGEGKLFVRATCVSAPWLHFTCAVAYPNLYLLILLFLSKRHQYQTQCKSSLDSPRMMLSISLSLLSTPSSISSATVCPSFSKLSCWFSFQESSNESTIHHQSLPTLEIKFHLFHNERGKFVLLQLILFLHFQDQLTYNPRSTNFMYLKFF